MAMPTVFIIEGFRFFFYSNDHAPMHVHVQHAGGEAVFEIRDKGGTIIGFPVAGNRRLATGTPTQLSHMEVSPFGIHWPDLDEDLSFEGLARGDYGQRIPATP